MNIKGFLLTAVSLTLGAGSTAPSAQGENYQAQRQSIAAIAPTLGAEQSGDLANLAADLARTAARLAEVQNGQQLESASASTSRTEPAFSDVEAARQFNAPSSTKAATVRWLGSGASSSTQDSPQQNRDQGFEFPEVVGIANNSPQPSDTTSSTARSDQPLRRLPSAEQTEVETQVVPAQANEEVFYKAQALQEDLEPQPADQQPAGDIADTKDDNYNASEPDAGSIENWGQPVYVSDSCCGPTCDDVCCQPPRPCRPRILVVGTEAVFLNPDINSQRSSYVFDNYGQSASHYEFGPGSGDSPNADLDDFYIAPRLWLGVQGECWGVVGRYFHMRAGEHGHDPFYPSPRDINSLPINPVDQGFDVNSIFEAYYADLELTRNFCLNGCKNQFTFGARYALIEHNESVFAHVEVDEGILSSHARSNRQARGTGLTFGLNGRKPLFCNSCAHWFYNVRSSVLWGCSHNEAETWSQTLLLDSNQIATAASFDGASAVVDDDLFIGEVQLGLEWDFAMRCLPAKSFFRLAFEYQYWDSSRGTAQSESFSGFGTNNSSAIGTATAVAPGIRADLLGFHVGTGFTW